MPRVDRRAATDLLTSWIADLSDGRLSARKVTSLHADIEVVDTRTGRSRPLKLAVREFSKSDRQGKNFQVRRAVLESDPSGIVILLHLNEGGLTGSVHPIRAAWVLSYRKFLSQGLRLSANGAYQCRPLFAPAETDNWSVYRWFSPQALVERVAVLCGTDGAEVVPP